MKMSLLEVKLIVPQILVSSSTDGYFHYHNFSITGFYSSINTS